MTINQKLLAGAFLYATWAALAVFGQAPIAEFVDFTRQSITALFIYHASLATAEKP